GDIKSAIKQPTQKIQDSFFDSFVIYMGDLNEDLQQQYINQENAYKASLIFFVCFLAISLFFVFFSWYLLKNTLITPLKKLGESISTISSGDLSKNISLEGKNEIAKLARSIELMRVNLVNIVNEIKTYTNHSLSGIGKLSSGNNELAARTEEQASALEETASSMEEISSTVKQNTENVANAASIVLSATNLSRNCGEEVNDVVRLMKDISEYSNKIFEITDVIDSIAFQTNILALNASVEAARAGEQGRGFAVVSGEVRELAQKCTDSAKNIKILIDNTVQKISSGSDMAEKAGNSMLNVVNSIEKINNIISEISIASSEQSKGIEQICTAVNEMDVVTQKNSNLVEQCAKQASSIEMDANELLKMVEHFKTDYVISLTHEKNKHNNTQKVFNNEDNWSSF
ncbi:HAMP domain-containing protein, partial [Salmonella enterica subsp. enterica serovar Kentucky]|nr:HAMP domain-containing protein [Salmonella enterica subsp. enterica serovar Kentucky]